MDDFFIKLQKMKSRVQFMETRSIRVGWPDGNKSYAEAKHRLDTGEKRKEGEIVKPASQALIAATLNFGRKPGVCSNGAPYAEIPARDFMGVAVKEYGEHITKVAMSQMKQVMDGSKSPGNAMRRIGVECKGAIQRAMLDSDKYLPNSPKTKKSHPTPDPKPLFDTGNLIASVDFEIK